MATEIKSANGATVLTNSDVTVKYALDKTVISNKSETKPLIYIPVTNPANPDYKLDQLYVSFAGGATPGKKTGMITDLWVYYGNDEVFHAGDDSWAYTASFPVPVWRDYKLPDSKSYGVLVTLQLSLPDDGSFIELYSIDLSFKDIKSK